MTGLKLMEITLIIRLGFLLLFVEVNEARVYCRMLSRGIKRKNQPDTRSPPMQRHASSFCCCCYILWGYIEIGLSIRAGTYLQGTKSW